MGIKCAIALLNFEGRNDRVEMVRHNSSISVGLEIKKKKKKNPQSLRIKILQSLLLVWTAICRRKKRKKASSLTFVYEGEGL